jgi:hypothetical protein
MTTTDDWKKTQDDLRAGVYGPWEAVRSMLAEAHSLNYPGDGISSSDTNHMAYGWAQGRNPLSAEDRERAQKLWDEGDSYATYAVISGFEVHR